jgi:hypothetical protein
MRTLYVRLNKPAIGLWSYSTRNGWLQDKLMASRDTHEKQIPGMGLVQPGLREITEGFVFKSLSARDLRE